ADVTPPAARGRAFGFHRGADHFGAVLGSLAAWYFLSRGANVRQVIAWSALPGLVAFVVLALVLAGRPTKTGGAGGRSAEHSNGVTKSASPGRAGFWPPILALAALTFCRIPEALLLLRLQQAGVAVALVPLVWAALHVVRSGASYPGGRLVDSVGPRIAVTAGAVLFALAIGVMGLESGTGRGTGACM